MGYYSSVLLATTRKGYGDILKKLKANKECERLVNSMQEMGETEDGRYIAFGWDGIKWMGYNFVDIQAAEKIFAECEEPIKIVVIGEDGRNESYFYGEEDYDMPYIDAGTRYDYEREWKMKVGAYI